jgi:DNA-binding beta-propeller fold protein YncE
MTLNARGNRAFVADNGSIYIKKCAVNQSGAISSCTDTLGENYSVPESVILNSAENIAFITSAEPITSGANHNKVTRCDVNAVGIFTNCAHTGTGFSIPSGINLNAAETKVFVTNVGSDTVSRCDVDKSTGLFTLCNDTGGTGFSRPTSIMLNASETRVFVTNNHSSTVSRCLVDINGYFTACENTQGVFNQPAGIALSNRIEYLSP